MGPKGEGYDASQMDPCKGSGNGAIPDETDPTKRAALEAAVTEAKAGLAATDLSAARADARKTETMLKAAD